MWLTALNVTDLESFEASRRQLTKPFLGIVLEDFCFDAWVSGSRLAAGEVAAPGQRHPPIGRCYA